MGSVSRFHLGRLGSHLINLMFPLFPILIGPAGIPRSPHLQPIPDSDSAGGIGNRVPMSRKSRVLAQRAPQACDGVGGSSPNGPDPSTLRPGQLVDVTVRSLLRGRSRPRRAARRLAERSGYIAVGDRVPSSSWTHLQTQLNGAAVQVLSLNETTGRVGVLAEGRRWPCCSH